MIVELEEKYNIIQNVIIGIYNGHLSKDGKYKALIGLDLLDYGDTVGVDVYMDPKIKC